jgi:hypothetical protein
LLTPGTTSVEVKVLETTDQEVTVTAVAKMFQNYWKNRLPRCCFPIPASSFSSSIDDKMPNGNLRDGRVRPELGSSVGITL